MPWAYEIQLSVVSSVYDHASIFVISRFRAVILVVLYIIVVSARVNVGCLCLARKPFTVICSI